MIVRVRLFAAIREALGRETIDITLPERSTTIRVRRRDRRSCSRRRRWALHVLSPKRISRNGTSGSSVLSVDSPTAGLSSADGARAETSMPSAACPSCSTIFGL